MAESRWQGYSVSTDPGALNVSNVTYSVQKASKRRKRARVLNDSLLWGSGRFMASHLIHRTLSALAASSITATAAFLGAPAVADVPTVGSGDARSVEDGASEPLTTDEKIDYLREIYGADKLLDQYREFISKDGPALVSAVLTDLYETGQAHRWPNTVQELERVTALTGEDRTTASREHVRGAISSVISADKAYQLGLAKETAKDREAKDKILASIGVSDPDTRFDLASLDNSVFIVRVLADELIPDRFPRLKAGWKEMTKETDAEKVREFLRVRAFVLIQEDLDALVDDGDKAKQLVAARITLAAECGKRVGEDSPLLAVPTVDYFRELIVLCQGDISGEEGHPHLIAKSRELVSQGDNDAADNFLLDHRSVVDADRRVRDEAMWAESLKLLSMKVTVWRDSRMNPYLVRKAQEAIDAGPESAHNFLTSLGAPAGPPPRHLTGRGLRTQAIRPATFGNQHQLVYRPQEGNRPFLSNTPEGEDAETGRLRAGNWYVESAKSGKEGCFSFNTVDGKSLMVEDQHRRVYAGVVGDDQVSKKRASWCPRDGHAGRGVSLESERFPHYFLRHYDYYLAAVKKVKPHEATYDYDNPHLFEDDTSWLIVDPDQRVRW